MRIGGRRLLFLSLIVMGLLVSNIGSAYAQSTSLVRGHKILSVNTIVNPGFESVISGTDQPLAWLTDYSDANVGSTISVNSTLVHSGDFAVRMDISQNQTSVRTGSPITFGHLTLRQVFPANTRVANLTNRQNDLNSWFNIQPKFAGFAGISVKVIALDTTTLVYALFNPALSISFFNSTNGGEAGMPTKFIVLPAPNLNQWNNLTRNLRQDWLSPLSLPNGTLVPGLYRDDQTLFSIEFDAFFFKDPLSNAFYGETAWIDDVAVSINIRPSHGHGIDPECATIDPSTSEVELVLNSQNCNAP